MPISNSEAILNRISNFVLFGVKDQMNTVEFLEKELARWENSPQRWMQMWGDDYYCYNQKIDHKERTMIADDGRLKPIRNVPNNKIKDNQYAKMVDQKANYLLGQPFVIETDDKQYSKALKGVFTNKFMRTLLKAGKNALNQGICWLYPHYDENGDFLFRVFPGYEICPIWAESDHTKLQGAIRLYSVIGYEGANDKLIKKVEVYDLTGIHCYIYTENSLVPDMNMEESECAYVMADGNPLNWTRIPLIPVKYNDKEVPLIKKCMQLQDAINSMYSGFVDNMQEDTHNTVLVLHNYDGTNLGEFRRNLSEFGAIKVRSSEGVDGGVEALSVDVNGENYQTVIKLLKQALIENAMGFDAKDDRLSGNPNRMNIQSMYSDIDLDANGMETELQAAFEDILWFVNMHLANTGQGNFEGQEVRITFNRDMMMNEADVINNIKNSVGILSTETLIANHPWVDDVELELERLEAEEQKNAEKMDPYNGWGTGSQDMSDEKQRILEESV